MENFVKNHRWSSIIPKLPLGSSELTRKSLTKHVYFFSGTPTRREIRINDAFLADTTTPFTLIVEDADLIIEGSLAGNGMYVVDNGDIIFEPESCDTSDQVRGIFITNGKFTTASTVNTTESASRWCKGGNLIISGLFIGSGIDEGFVSKRRASLDLWSIEDVQDISQNEYLLRKNAIGNKLIEGPSVRIDTTPSSRSELPPGVRELFESVEVRK